MLPVEFDSLLVGLGPNDGWLDIGAGSGHAILDYFDSQTPDSPTGRAGFRNASAVGISIEDRRGERWRTHAAIIGDRKIQYRFGQPLRKYSRRDLGEVQLVTDVFGGFSYTDDLSRFMESLLDLLAPGGHFLTLIQSVHLQENKDTWFLTEIFDDADRIVPVCHWLARISCVQVTCDSRSTWDTPTELVKVRKACSQISVPPLETIGYESGTPPGRRFRLGDGSGRKTAEDALHRQVTTRDVSTAGARPR